MAGLYPEYNNFLPDAPNFMTPAASTSESPAPVLPKPAAPYTGPRGRGGVPIWDPMAPTGTPRTVGMAPFRKPVAASTANAVALAARGGEDSDIVPPNTSTPAPAQPTVANTTRVGPSGDSKVYPNLEPSNDLNLPSFPSFQMPQFNGGGQGMLPATATQHPLEAKADQLLAQADALGSSGGLVDMWRARGMRRNANELYNHAAAMKQVNVAAQANDIRRYGIDTAAQTALFGDLVRKYAVDTGAATSKYGTDATAKAAAESNATAQRGQDMTFATHLPELKIKGMAASALESGDLDTARDILTASAPRVGTPPKFEVLKDAAGNAYGMVDTTGQRQGVVPLPSGASLQLKAMQEAEAAKEKKTKEK